MRFPHSHARYAANFIYQKCDGTKPVCGPCLRHPKDDPCEYADSPRRSRTKVLEDQVARLEARLKDLEQPEQSPSVTLHDPYSNDPYQDIQMQSLTTYPPSTSETFSHSPSSPYSVSTSLSITSTPPPSETIQFYSDARLEADFIQRFYLANFISDGRATVQR